MNQPTKASVVFLRDSEGRICLAQKKQPIHHAAGEISHSLGTWNGYGGKREAEDKTIEETTVRELLQESGVVSYKGNLISCGHVYFFWPKNEGTEKSSADMEVFFFFLDVWGGDPKEGDEMGVPQFFYPYEIPYDNMMEGDKVLFPRMILGEVVNGSVHLGKKDYEGNVLFVEDMS